jgi:hypothetical protein
MVIFEFPIQIIEKEELPLFLVFLSVVIDTGVPQLIAGERKLVYDVRLFRGEVKL